MTILEDYLKPTQKGLFKMIHKRFKGNCIISDDNFILVRGEAPILLVAHMDTVHKEPVRDICKSKNGVLMSPQGIGGDDRCGVYALIKIHELSKCKPWLLFTCDEEVGGLGASNFCTRHKQKSLPKELDSLKLIIEIDRRGSDDAVYYDCANLDFENYITSKGFKTEYGSFSDISYIAPELGVAAVNLSSGYYNAHTLYEYIVRSKIEHTIQKVCEIVAESARADFPKYDYIEKEYEPVRRYDFSYIRNSYGYYGDKYMKSSYSDAKNSYGNDKQYSDESVTSNSDDDLKERKKLPYEYEQIYSELLEIYTEEELESYRESFGDEVIYQIYIDEYGPFYADLK